MANLLINQGTQAAVNFDTVGSVNTQVVAIGYGTISTIGSLPNVTLANPTGTTVQFNNGTINTGTLVLSSGTLTTIPNIPGGTLNVLQGGSVAVTAGTINSGTISSGTINTGTFVYTGGTLNLIGTVNTIGTLPNLPGGTLTNSGTVTGVGVVTSLTNGSIVVTNGTMVQTTGTINAGTINTGTIQLNPLTAANTILNAGTVGTAAIGTLVSSAAVGAGTSLFVTGYEILAISGTPEVALSFGTTIIGNQVISHGLFSAGGGVTKAKTFATNYGTTNAPLTYQIVSGSGTVSWSVDYFLHT